MGKLDSGIFGPIRGKTSDINFKYANGKNIASKYVPNPHNPKTTAQIAHRNLFTALNQLFGHCDKSLFVITGFGKQSTKNYLKKFVGELLTTPPENVDLSNMEFIWSIYFWRWLIQQLEQRNWPNGIGELKIIDNSLIFDRIVLDAKNEKTAGAIASCYMFGVNPYFESIPKFCYVRYPLTGYTNNDLAVFSICYWRTNWYDEETGTYPSWPHASVNIGGHMILPLYYPNGGYLPQYLLDELSNVCSRKVSKSGKNIECDNIMLLNSDYINKIGISNLDHKSSFNIQKLNYTDKPASLEIDWDFKLPAQNLYNVFQYSEFGTYFDITPEFVIPEKYAGLPWHIEVVFNQFVSGGFCELRTITGATYENNISASDLFGFIEHPFFGAMYVVIDGVCCSAPYQLYSRPSEAYSWKSLLSGWNNEATFRCKKETDLYNVELRIWGTFEHNTRPIPATTVSLTVDGSEETFTGETDNCGVINFTVPVGCEIKAITCSKPTYQDNIIVTHIKIHEFENYWLGPFELTPVHP